MDTSSETHVCVPISTRQFLALASFLDSKADTSDPVEVISRAIDYWMDNADWKPELLAQSDGRGYQWKNLFLPHGTQVRMQYKGKYFYAQVTDDELLYEGKATSPGSLANNIAGSSRNAWRDLCIKLPEDAEWKLADMSRREEKQELARIFSKLSEIRTDEQKGQP